MVPNRRTCYSIRHLILQNTLLQKPSYIFILLMYSYKLPMTKILQFFLFFLLLYLTTGCYYVGEMEKHQNRQKAYVTTHPKLREDFKAHILKGNVVLGMTTDEVMASIGKPHNANQSVGSWGVQVHEQWIYGSEEYDNYSSGATHFVPAHYFNFENSILTSWQD